MRALAGLLVLVLAVSPAAAQPRIKAPVAPIAPAVPVAPAPVLTGGGFAPMRGLAPSLSQGGLRPVSDARPVCRARCAQDRYTCGDEEHCASRWNQCVSTCSLTGAP
jgi:hypothetical protein